MTYDDVQHLAAKIKPKQQRVDFSPFWTSFQVYDASLTKLYSHNAGWVGNWRQHTKSQLLSEQRRADRLERRRDRLRWKQHLLNVRPLLVTSLTISSDRHFLQEITLSWLKLELCDWLNRIRNFRKLLLWFTDTAVERRSAAHKSTPTYP